MRQIKSCSFIALFLLFILSFGIVETTSAEKLKFPTSKPNFSIEFPAGWFVEPDDHALHAGPKDKTLYFGILPIPPDTDSDKVGEVIGGIVDQLVSDLGEGEDTQVEINGIKFFITDSSGKSKDGGEPVDVSFGFFSPYNDGKEINALIYFGPPSAGDKYEEDIKSILASIHTAKRG